MNSTCKVCEKSFEYEPLKEILDVKLSDLRPSICSSQCESRIKEELQREVSKNVFYRILNVMPECYKGVNMSDFSEMTLKSSIRQEVFKGADELIQRFCNSDYWNISLFSPVYGNGKTRLGLYILACLALKGVYKMREITSIQDTGYYSAIDICKLLRTESFDSKQFYQKRFYNSRALMIDDLGQEPENQAVEISGILKVREENKRKTIITSNLTKDQLEKRYTGRVYSRLAKGAFLVEGNDRRIEK